MAIVIGTDEAGYGPNLGPLVITATVWQLPAEHGAADLYSLLDGFVARTLGSEPSSPLVIADSKQLYHPGGGLAALERGVLASLTAMQYPCARWRDVWQAVGAASDAQLDAIPWHDGFDLPVPQSASVGDIQRLASSLAEGLRSRRVVMRAIRSRAVFPEQWNEWNERFSSKGEVLARETLQIVREVMEGLEAASSTGQDGRPIVGRYVGDPAEDTDAARVTARHASAAPALVVQCDKFGGRNRYAPLLQTTFPEYLVEVLRESRALSLYRWGPAERRVEFQFAAKGERFLPSALASMTSKYLRELAMLAFNHFWTQRVPGLAPTAGYPTDARRFKRDIAAVQSKLGIDDRVLWRCK